MKYVDAHSPPSRFPVETPHSIPQLADRMAGRGGAFSREPAHDCWSRITIATVVELVSVDGVQLEYALHGPSPAHAPTLVFLHEGLGSISQWRDFPAALCSRTECGGLVYNRRGHGKSDPLVGPRSLGFMHDEALAVLPRLLDM